MHDRFVTQQADSQRSKCMWGDLSPAEFTVASVDNFDMLQSHAAVYCGNQQRSYHGTTMQIVQPTSMLEVYHNDQISSTTAILPLNISENVAQQTTDFAGTSSAVSKRMFEQSPSNSPHKVGKIGPKRPRTVVVPPEQSGRTRDGDHYTID